MLNLIIQVTPFNIGNKRCWLSNLTLYARHLSYQNSKTGKSKQSWHPKKGLFTMNFQQIITEVDAKYMNLLQLKLYTHVI